jgi:hypothetical protein
MPQLWWAGKEELERIVVWVGGRFIRAMGLEHKIFAVVSFFLAVYVIVIIYIQHEEKTASGSAGNSATVMICNFPLPDISQMTARWQPLSATFKILTGLGV